MFSKYDEISKIISTYVNDSLLKPRADASVLNQNLQNLFGVSLSEIDITNLTNAIDSAKSARSDWQNGINNAASAVTDWSNALEKAKDLVDKKEGYARSLAFTYARKICIASYKGPLTLDTMRELKENGYDGTYGPTTLIQMYALYSQNQKLEEDNKQKDAIIVGNNQQIAQYDSRYRELYVKEQQHEIEIHTLKQENQNLRAHLGEQNKVIASLSEKIESLSKKISVQLMDMLRNVLGQHNNQQIIEDETNKTM